jgi:hypothetical protein
MAAALPHGGAAEPFVLSDHELDLVAAGATSSQRRSVARHLRLVGYEVVRQRHALGFAAHPWNTAIALLLPAIQQVHVNRTRYH